MAPLRLTGDRQRDMPHAMARSRHSKLPNEACDDKVNRAGGWSREQIVRMDERYVAAERRTHRAASEHDPWPCERGRERRARSA